jgi:hypothetical protein
MQARRIKGKARFGFPRTPVPIKTSLCGKPILLSPFNGEEFEVERSFSVYL